MDEKAALFISVLSQYLAFGPRWPGTPKIRLCFVLSSTSEPSGLCVLDTVILPPVYYVTDAGDVIDYGVRR
jgi:hypothetical protein